MSLPSAPKPEVPLEGIKGKLQETFRKRRIWEMVPNCNELLVLSKDLSVADTIKILSENIIGHCILIDQDKNCLVAILLVADFITFLLSLAGPNQALLEDEGLMAEYLSTTPIGRFLQTYKKYNGRPCEEIIHREDTDPLSDLIATFNQNKIGKVLIKTKSLENLCIFTKKDLVVSLLQNFRPSAPDLQYLDRSIEQVEADVKIMLTPQEIVSLRTTQTLHEGLQTIKDRQAT